MQKGAEIFSDTLYSSKSN